MIFVYPNSLTEGVTFQGSPIQTATLLRSQAFSWPLHIPESLNPKGLRPPGVSSCPSSKHSPRLTFCLLLTILIVSGLQGVRLLSLPTPSCIRRKSAFLQNTPSTFFFFFLLVDVCYVAGRFFLNLYSAIIRDQANEHLICSISLSPGNTAWRSVNRHPPFTDEETNGGLREGERHIQCCPASVWARQDSSPGPGGSGAHVCHR